MIDVPSSDGLKIVVVVGGTVVVVEGAVVDAVDVELVAAVTAAVGAIAELVLATVVGDADSTDIGLTDGWLAVLPAQAVGRNRTTAPAAILMPNPPIGFVVLHAVRARPRACQVSQQHRRRAKSTESQKSVVLRTRSLGPKTCALVVVHTIGQQTSPLGGREKIARRCTGCLER